MIRALIVTLTILHLGPGIAFALLAFGCGAPEPALPAACGPKPVASFAWLTLLSWVVLGAGLAAWQLVERARLAPAGAPAARVIAILVVLSFGALLAAGGSWLTGSNHAVLAVPAALALAWLRLANPEACVTSRHADGARPK